jgi:hypothetical protein
MNRSLHRHYGLVGLATVNDLMPKMPIKRIFLRYMTVSINICFTLTVVPEGYSTFPGSRVIWNKVPRPAGVQKCLQISYN